MRDWPSKRPLQAPAIPILRWNIENDIAAGRLVSVLEDWLPEEPGLCLYYPQARHPSAGLRALIAFVGDRAF